MASNPLHVAEVFFEDLSVIPTRTETYQVFANKTIKVGRDPEKNAIVISDPQMSRNHLEIYSIIVDQETKHGPLVFVRDRLSNNGTYVNEKLIGNASKVSLGRLLEDGDVVTISRPPIARFCFKQTFEASSSTLSSLQRRESALFKDKYEISGRTIGDGAHAVVYLATEKRTGGQVVCKVHNLAGAYCSARRLQRIRQEATLLSYLDHPNIISIRAAFQTNNTMYIFTEMATGGDLFSLLMRYNTFRELEIRWILWQVLRAIAYIHRKGVAHRDIKPENILCAMLPNAACRIVLTDFGDSAMASTGRMKSGVGTSFYRAPECRTPDQAHDLSVDIWAIGMLVLQLFSGLYELPDIYHLTLNNQDKIDEYLRRAFDTVQQETQMSSDSMDFIRSCLVYDSDARPAAHQLFKNRWFREPKDDQMLFRRLEKDVLASWSPRGIVLPVIEDLTTDLPARPAAQSNALVTSPYFEVPRILPNDLQVERRDNDHSSHGTPVEIHGSITSSQRTVRAEALNPAVLNGGEGQGKRGAGVMENLASKRPRHTSL
ncbi:kinase-like domain-containing protein [Podospora aff. communis PSN243]|uniref:Kinase-like domain-containing protein n=1 Tax=Podospora aff. communis PSN243 TaxID=3040156 RepID=A0AAV9G740_9PEZI|nr:kinase-like domain-containing protein [Podospora aff. communis PSN243]